MLGLLVGSFLNVVIHRVPVMLERAWRRECLALDGRTPPEEPAYNLVTPRSACPGCKAPITALQNIPRAELAAAARPLRELPAADRPRATRWSNC